MLGARSNLQVIRLRYPPPLLTIVHYSLFLCVYSVFFDLAYSDPISGTRSPQEDWKKWRSCKQRQQRWNVTPTVSLCCRFSAAAAVREAVGYVPPIPPPPVGSPHTHTARHHNWTKRKLISASRRTDFLFLLQGANPTTGTLTGMTLRTSRAGILRAIMESVALRLKGVFTSISSLLPDDSFEVSFLHLRYIHNMKLLYSLCFQINICCSDVLLCSLSDSPFSRAAPNSHCINDVNRCMHPEMHCSSPRCGNRSWSTLSASGYISCPARN